MAEHKRAIPPTKQAAMASDYKLQNKISICESTWRQVIEGMEKWELFLAGELL